MLLGSQAMGWAEICTPKRCKPLDPYSVAKAQITASTPAANHAQRDWLVIGIRTMATRDKDKRTASAWERGCQGHRIMRTIRNYNVFFTFSARV